ncbi:hypothetical protein [Methylobacterium sp. Leaf88]|uniref:hypothetical protein n=1 Tax=Methylobacterium sp. Leaf88 TaxID=1736244 RepID=UPI0012E87591|nr:hypothetical protein [Methylobacterium sp. Leaf88]
MDSFLRENLVTCLAVYISAVGGRESTIGQRAAGDWRFFRRLADPSVTFTIRKYEEVMLWFRANWPADAAWPENVPDPKSVDQYSLFQLTAEQGNAHVAEIDPYRGVNTINPRSVQA